LFPQDSLNNPFLTVITMRELAHEIKSQRPEKPYPADEELSRREHLERMVRRFGGLLVRLGERLERVGL
jgi:hypothetical protein